MFGFFWNKKDNKKEAEAKEAEAKEAEIKKLALINPFLFDFIFVEGGEFIMGDDCVHNATPHKVTVSSFYMQASTVTQELWEAVMGNNPSEVKTWKDNPVTNVIWDDCQKFIKKLNAITGKKYRLPTEAEWEYAARGGKLSKGFKYAGSNDINEVAWYNENSNGKIHPVKEKKPNELGIYDMSGNIWEWCNDWYADYRLNEAYSKNPQGPDGGVLKVVRGGSWSNNAVNCLVARRFSWNHDFRFNDEGFRLLSPVE